MRMLIPIMVSLMILSGCQSFGAKTDNKKTASNLASETTEKIVEAKQFNAKIATCWVKVSEFFEWFNKTYPVAATQPQSIEAQSAVTEGKTLTDTQTTVLGGAEIKSKQTETAAVKTENAVDDWKSKYEKQKEHDASIATLTTYGVIGLSVGIALAIASMFCVGWPVIGAILAKYGMQAGIAVAVAGLSLIVLARVLDQISPYVLFGVPVATCIVFYLVTHWAVIREQFAGKTSTPVIPDK